MTKEIPLFGAVVGQLSQRTRKMGHPTIVMLKRRIPTAGMAGGVGIPRAWNDGKMRAILLFPSSPTSKYGAYKEAWDLPR